MRFFVTYQMPYTAVDTWMQLPETERVAQDAEMQEKWNAWMAAHKSVLIETAGLGRPKRVTKDGVVDARNDLMMYSFIEADSLEAAAALFKDNPHSLLPDGAIEIMPVADMSAVQ